MNTQWACLRCQHQFETQAWRRPDGVRCPVCGCTMVRALHVEPSPVTGVGAEACPELDLGLAILMEAQTW